MLQQTTKSFPLLHSFFQNPNLHLSFHSLVFFSLHIRLNHPPIMIFSFFGTSYMTSTLSRQNAFFSFTAHPTCGAYTLILTMFAFRTALPAIIRSHYLITYTNSPLHLILLHFFPLSFLCTTFYNHSQLLSLYPFSILSATHTQY